MKITKKQNSNKVTASTEAILVEDPAVSEVAAVPTCKYEDTINLITAAIESLAVIAKDDQIAKDSIANLGVVLLDLKGDCIQ